MPPVRWIVGIVADVANDRSRIVANTAVPDQAHASRVGLRGHNDDHVRVIAATVAGNFVDFLFGVRGRVLEDANGIRGNSLGHKNLLIIKIFTNEGVLHALVLGRWTHWLGNPDLRGEVALINAGRFHGA